MSCDREKVLVYLNQKEGNIMQVKCVIKQEVIEKENLKFKEGNLYICDKVTTTGKAYVQDDKGFDSILYEGEYEFDVGFEL